MRLTTFIAAALLVAGLALISACERQTPPPAATSPGTARIVALSPAVAVILRDLGYENAIVGRHAFDRMLHPSLPVCGDQAGIDYEAVVSVTPTHIFTQWGSRDLPSRLVQLAKDNRWSLHDSRLLSLDDIATSVKEIDDLLSGGGGSSAGDRLQVRMKAAWAQREGDLSKAGKVLLLASVSPPSALGPGSCHHEILLRLGATPALTEGSPYVSLDNETILSLAPDVIILVAPGTDPASTSLEAVARLGPIAQLDIPAVKRLRVSVVTNPLGLTPSTPMIDLADEFAFILRTWSAQSPP
jgi:ABC-type hemin transport system substrate-binding protein